MGRASIVTLLVSAVLASSLGACFFTQPINSRPEAVIDQVGTGPFYRGDTIEFTAFKSSDPDSTTGELTAEWLALECESEEVCTAITSRQVMPISERFELTVDTHAELRVQLIVTDPNDAKDRDIAPFSIVNRDPSVELQVQGVDSPGDAGFVLGLPIDLYAQADDPDGDPVELTWELYPATGSTAAVFEEIEGGNRRLTPDVSGLYRVLLRATDEFGGLDEIDEQILVAVDGAPCIGGTDPEVVDGTYIVGSDEAPRRLAVLSVSDDLDPYPRVGGAAEVIGESAFLWKIATPDTGGELVPVSGHEAADYFVDPGIFAPGDQIRVRVDVSDRTPRELQCPEEQATCGEVPGECLQRVTWSMEIR